MPHLETIKVDRDLPLAEIDGFIIKCNSGTAYALTAMHIQGELLVMDEQAISLLAEIRDLLQQTKERDDAWLEEVRQRDKAMDKHSRQIEAKYDKWRKEDLARIKRNHEIAERNYQMAVSLYEQNLQRAFHLGVNTEKSTKQVLEEQTQPISREEMLDLLKDEIEKKKAV